VQLGPQAPLPQARLAEIHLMRGETRQARRVAEAAVQLGGGSLTQLVLGYAELAALRGARAETAFRRALSEESWNPLALMGLGLAEIKQGDLSGGTAQIENAVTHDPGSSLLRSYLGKAYFEARSDGPAGTQYAIAKELDPRDPTPWFYDAIRKQLDNRPIEALRDLEHSIELNDDRAPFRSRLLLDKDTATRGVSLGRIYRDLGFEQLGVVEAAKSLATDPASSAGHRLLADLYLGAPRLEAARVSQLLQAQLLQPVGTNPIQPSQTFIDLDLIRRSGPSLTSFNEYTPLFTRDGARGFASGLIGNDATKGDELLGTVLYGRTSISLGQFHYETDGFRDNYDLSHDILTAFAQTDPTEWLSLQGEYRWRDTNQGDRVLNFDLDDFDPLRHEDVEQRLARLGARFTLGPGHQVIVSGLHGDRRNRFDEEFTDLKRFSTNRIACRRRGPRSRSMGRPGSRDWRRPGRA
jgi:tetratricopeptide (TPR) repeat protein